jgi:hypothetical protein
MAKPSKPVPTRPYPSEFGSHSVMIDQEATDKLNPQVELTVERELVREDGQLSLADLPPIVTRYPEMVVCKDQFGLYTTEKWRLDNNMADPNRCAGSRIKYEK